MASTLKTLQEKKKKKSPLPAGIILSSILAVSRSLGTCSWQPKSESWNKNCVYFVLLAINWKK